MAQVPYNPVPSTTLSGTPTPQMNPASPLDAFGGAIGESLKGLGRVTEKAGDEIFARAVAMQTLQNQTDALEADTRYMRAAGDLHAKYNSLEGKDAVEAYPHYVQDLEGVRRTIRNELPNPAAAKLYDQSSKSTMGRTIFNGAGHAASENKKWASGTMEAQLKAVKDAALASPMDDESFKAGLGAIDTNVENLASLHGWSDEQANQFRSQQISDLWSNRVSGLARTNPIAAKKMFDDAVGRGEIRGEQMGKVNNVVQNGLWQQGSRNISAQVRSGSDGYWGSGKVNITSARSAVGGFESGDNYQAQGVEVFDKAGNSRGRALGRYQVMPENLAPWLKESGLPPMTAKEFLNSPSAQDKVFDTIFGGYMEKYGSFNEAVSRWFTGVGVDEARAQGRKDANKTTVDEYIKQTNSILARNVPLQDKVQRGKELAAQASPDDPIMEDYVTNRIETDHGRDRRVKLDDEYTNTQTVNTGLMGGADGKLPTSVDDLKAQGPEMEAAWMALPPAKQRSYLKVMAANAKGDKSWTEQSLRAYQGYKGMAQSDPVSFLDLDVPGLDIPVAARRELINLQGRVKKNAEGDPRVTRALQILGPQLQAAGITRDQKDTYFQFVGALQDGLQDLAGETKKTPTIEEVKLLGSRLLQTKAGTGWFGTSVGASQMFNLPPPTKEYDAIKADPKWQELGIIPTDQQIQRIYNRKVFNDLYGGKGKVEAKAKEAGPQVPVSR